MARKENILLKYLHRLTNHLSLSPFYYSPPLPSLLSSFHLHWNAPKRIGGEHLHTPDTETERNRFRRYDLSRLAVTDDARCCKRGGGRGESVGERVGESVGEMESFMKGIRGDAPCVLDMDPTHTVGGGVEDFYGEDHATEDQLVTPWTISVARSPPLFLYYFSSILFQFSNPLMCGKKLVNCCMIYVKGWRSR